MKIWHILYVHKQESDGSAMCKVEAGGGLASGKKGRRIRSTGFMFEVDMWLVIRNR